MLSFGILSAPKKKEAGWTKTDSNSSYERINAVRHLWERSCCGVGLVLFAEICPNPEKTNGPHGKYSLYVTLAIPSPSNIVPPMGHLDPLNIWFFVPTQDHTLKGISIGLAIYAGLMIVTDRPTDRSCYSVYNVRPHLRSITVMRPKK